MIRRDPREVANAVVLQSRRQKFSFLAPGRRQVGGPGHAAGQAADVLLEVIVVLLQFAQVRLHVLAPIDQGVEAGLDFHCMTTR